MSTGSRACPVPGRSSPSPAENPPGTGGGAARPRNGTTKLTQAAHPALPCHWRPTTGRSGRASMRRAKAIYKGMIGVPKLAQSPRLSVAPSRQDAVGGTLLSTVRNQPSSRTERTLPPIGAERERGRGVVVAGHNGVSCAVAATVLPRAWLANFCLTWVTRLPGIAAMPVVIVAALPLATASTTPRATRSKACRRASGA